MYEMNEYVRIYADLGLVIDDINGFTLKTANASEQCQAVFFRNI